MIPHLVIVLGALCAPLPLVLLGDLMLIPQLCPDSSVSCTFVFPG